MHPLLPVLPIVVPLAGAAVCLPLRRPRLQRALAVAGSVAVLVGGAVLLAETATRGPSAVPIGGWPAPFGIVLVADVFSAVMVTLAGAVALAATAFSLAEANPLRERLGHQTLVLILLAGVSGAFLAGDLFNLYVWFEVLLMASFVLAALGGDPARIRGAIKYVTLNLLASAMFLAAVGLLYGLTGTLNLAHLAVRLPELTSPPVAGAPAMLLLTAFGIKAAIFPLFFWLPAAYTPLPVSVSALFAGLLTKVGVYALIRVFTLVFADDPAFAGGLLLVPAGLTMITGVLGAVAQTDMRRLLSFHIISQIGYLLMGLGLAGSAPTPELRTLALAGTVYFLIHVILCKSSLFLAAGTADRLTGAGFDLDRLGGLYRHHPAAAAAFFLPAFSLAGMPPLSGFVAKLTLISAALASGAWAIAAVALATGLLTLLSMTKIWTHAYWAPRPDRPADAPPPPTARQLRLMLAPQIAVAVVIALIGLAAGPVLELSALAARRLLDRGEYIRAVLGGPP